MYGSLLHPWSLEEAWQMNNLFLPSAILLVLLKTKVRLGHITAYKLSVSYWCSRMKVKQLGQALAGLYRWAFSLGQPLCSACTSCCSILQPLKCDHTTQHCYVFSCLTEGPILGFFTGQAISFLKTWVRRPFPQEVFPSLMKLIYSFFVMRGHRTLNLSHLSVL